MADPAIALRDVPLDRASAAGRAIGRRQRCGRGRLRSFDVLRRWGLTTVGELAALPADALSARLGADGIALQRLARGQDPRPLVPDPAVRRFLESLRARMADRHARAAVVRASRGCSIRWPPRSSAPTAAAIALHLRLRLTDRTTHLAHAALPVPMRDPRVLRTLLLLDLESHPPAAAIDVVTIEIDPAPGRVVQYSLLERPVPSPETLATLMARLGALVGDTRCGSPQLLDTHRPDGWSWRRSRSTMRRFAPRLALRGSTRRLRLAPGPPRLRRSKRCRRRRWCCAGSGRRWRFGSRSKAGRPVRVAIDRRGMPGGVVQDAAGPWRTSGGWWESQRWDRDEWDVALDGGAVCRLFQDRDTGHWFAEGVYD